jgi:hypothetical protein
LGCAPSAGPFTASQASLVADPGQVSAQPLGYTEDWGLIQIDPKVIDEETFLGNKVFVGTSFPWFCPVSPFCRTFSTVMAIFR